MRTRAGRRVLGVVIAIVLIAAGCGGDDDGNDPSAEPPAGSDDGAAGDDGAGDAADDDGSDGVAAEGPIAGPLVSVLSFDFGLFALDPDTGDERALAIEDTGYSDRTNPAVVSTDGTTAYLVTFTQVEDQSFTNEVALGAIDLATGTGSVIVEFGPDRSDDESTDLIETRVVGATSTDVWVEQKMFGSSERVLIGIDRTTGAESVRVTGDREGDVRIPIVEGEDLYAQVGGVISRADGDAWVSVIDLNDLGLDQALTPETINDYAVTRSGAPIDAEWAESIIGFGEPRPSSGWVGGDGSLWWVWGSINSRDDETAILGGMVQFDPTTAAIVGSWPLGDQVGEFLEENSVTTATQGSWMFLDGNVWFADARENGPLFRLDPASGVTAFTIELRDGIDYTSVTLIPSDPDGLWLEVEEWVITSDDESGRSSTATTNLERFDPSTGASVLVVPESDLIGF